MVKNIFTMPRGRDADSRRATRNARKLQDLG